MFDKIASETMHESFNLGFTIYGIMKQAAQGSPEASEFMKQAMEGEMPMDPAMMAEGGGGGMPPAPTVVCPQCQSEITPSPEGMCPVCGFDFNSLMSEAPMEDPGMPAPSPEEMAAAEGQMKAAAIADPEVMKYLMVNYGGWQKR
ncbi:MAG: hypothetical protein DRN30_04950 [Thermoplasmata archaeon]|nr:MAG: hypothetical protein DRN30_04950 [Thermoplasmata archaeon]